MRDRLTKGFGGHIKHRDGPTAAKHQNVCRIVACCVCCKGRQEPTSISSSRFDLVPGMYQALNLLLFAARNSLVVVPTADLLPGVYYLSYSTAAHC
jgi:hypothetical protein